MTASILRSGIAKFLDMDRWWLAFEQKVGDLNEMFAGGETFDLRSLDGRDR